MKANVANSVDQREEQEITTDTYENTITVGGVAWDQRNVMEFVDADATSSCQGKNGQISEIGYLLTWGHLNKALSNCVVKCRNAHVMMAIQTPIKFLFCFVT